MEAGGGLEKATQWPDILGHGAGQPQFFVADRVVQSLNNVGIVPARLTQMPVAEINVPKLRLHPPAYYVYEAAPGIEIDYTASNIPIDSDGNPIRHIMPRKVVWKFKLNSWTGVDLFGRPNIWKRPTSSLLCTEKIVELAQRDRWTNVKFEPIFAV